MGLLDGLFGVKVSNPALVNAVQAYKQNPTDDHLVNLWQQFFKAKLIVITTADGAKVLAKSKNIKEGVSQSCETARNDKGETLLAAFSDNDALQSYSTAKNAYVALTGEQIYALVNGKNLPGIYLNPRSGNGIELKVWQYLIYIEKVTDARKLQGFANRCLKVGNYADAEGIFKGAIVAAQRDPGPFHPFTAELNVELARAMESQQKFNEAEWVYKKALQCYEGAGQQDLNVAKTSEALGFLFKQNGKTASAFPALTRAMEIYETIPGGKPDSVAKILLTLAEIREAEGKDDDAEQLYKRAAVSLEERKHPDLPGIINKLARFCEKQGRPKEAVSNYRRSLQLWIPEKSKPTDRADAEYKLAILLGEEGKFAEADELMRKAIEAYKSVGEQAMVAEIETKLEELTKKKEEEPAAKPAAPYGRPAARPGVDLPPLLDVRATRTKVAKNPWNRDPLTGAGDDEEVAEAPKVLTPEEEALEKMRDFLESFDKESPQDGSAPATPTEAEAEDSPEFKKNTEENLRQMRSFLSTYEGPAKTEAPIPAQTPEPVEEQPKSLIQEAKVDAAFETLLAGKTPASDRYDTPISERVKQQAAPAEEPESKSFIQEAKVDAAFDTLLAGRTPVSDRYDTPISERLKQQSAPAPEPAAPAVSLPAEEPQSKSFIQEAKVDAAFDTLLAGKTPVSDRYDTPISERLKQQASAAAPPETPVTPPPSPVQEEAPSKSFIQEAKVDAAFDTLLAGRTPVSDRYDTPISERLKQQAAESAPEPVEPVQSKSFIQEAKVDAAFDTLLAGKTPVSDRYDTPISERVNKPPVEQMQLGEEPRPRSERDSKVNDAFASLLSGTSAAAPAQDDPMSLFPSLGEEPKPKGLIQEAKVDAAFDNLLGGASGSDRFDKPISERLKEQKAPPSQPAPVESQAGSAFDSLLSGTPPQSAGGLISESKVDAAFEQLLGDDTASSGRFDVPISERMSQESPNGAESEPPQSKGIIAEEKIDAAFDALLGGKADDDRFEMPIAERLKLMAEATEPVQEHKEAIEIPVMPEDQETTIESTNPDAVEEPPQPEKPQMETAPLFDSDGESDAFSKMLFGDEELLNPTAPDVVSADEEGSMSMTSTVILTPEQEIAHFEALLEVDPDNCELLLKKGSILLSQDRVDEAMKVFDKVTTLTPNNYSGWYYKGSCLRKRNRHDDALYCFNHALRLNPYHTRSLLEKADSLIKGGRGELGMAVYDKLLIIEPTHIEAWLAKAQLFVGSGKFTKAVECYDRVLELEPEHEIAGSLKEDALAKIEALSQ